MITLDRDEKEIRQEQEKVILQVNSRPAGFMGMQTAINERGQLVTVPVVYGKENKL